LCNHHKTQQIRHGAPGKIGIRETDYKPYNVWTGAGILKYRNTKATEAALALANRLLNYTATNDFRYQFETQRMMGLLRDDQVTAADVIHRIALHVAYASANPDRFTGGERVERLAIARCVMRLAPLRRRSKKYSARALYLIGDIVMSDGLYLWAIKLIDRLKRDDEEAYSLKQSALDFDTPAEVPADEPRSGVAYRRQRGVQCG
jgi:hypothetical protein